MSTVTVLTSVYNGMPYLRESIESVRRQTFRDWTLLIVNDGSTDETADYLDQLHDPQIRVVHQSNQGLAAALNHGLSLVESEFLARIDADDVMLPTRLEKQLAFLQSHPRIGLLGTQIAPWGEKRVGRGVAIPCDHATIDARILQGRHAMCHSSIMCRTALLKQIGGYWSYRVAQDWDMYLRMAEQAELANLPEVLLHVRILGNGTQSKKMAELRYRVAYACELARLRRQGLEPISDDEFRKTRQAAPIWKRCVDALDMNAMVHYRKAEAEILGTRPLLGYGRLAFAAACSPLLTYQRVVRAIRHMCYAQSHKSTLNGPSAPRSQGGATA